MVGDSDIARAFYAGRYAQILEQTQDLGADAAPHDVAFVVGALTFVDRVDEARALVDAWRARRGRVTRVDAAGDATVDVAGDRTEAACRFFLGLAAARAGYFDRSFPLLVRAAFRDRHHVDAWVRALVFQGIACQCYFTGRYPGAARNALRAQHAAHEATFLWTAMLATDMRGHSLVQMGQLQRGIAMLEQAKKQAHRLGLTNNAFAVDTSIATYVTRFVPTAESLDRVEALLRRRAHDSYSQRALLTEAAVQRALRGRRTDAVKALEAADKDALRGDTRRGKVVSFLARMWVTRWQRGPAACRALLEQARELVEARDVAFRAELLGFEILVARTDGDLAREARALDELRLLWRSTHHFYARGALEQFDPTIRPRPFDEDAVAPILRAVAHRDVSAVSRIVSLGLLGTLPELLGLVPGRRIIVLPAEDLILLEDHGDIVVRQRPPRWCPALLRILASGDSSKERIVAGLWGLRAYHPEIHDPPVRTAIHRLRTYLAPYGTWIEVGEDGYRSTVPVHLVTSTDAPAPETAPLWDEGEAPALEPQRLVPAAPRGRALAETSTQLVYQRLSELEEATVPQLAKSLEVSQSTVVRALRELIGERRVERLGFARATRYRPRDLGA